MTRVITSNEIKPDMTIRWETGGITHECVVEAVTPSLASGAVDLDAVGDGFMRIERATLVTVLSEPKPVQPEEPTTLGARVVVGDLKFVRGYGTAWPWIDSLDGETYEWSDICDYGAVTVLDADPSWTVPTS